MGHYAEKWSVDDKSKTPFVVDAASPDCMRCPGAHFDGRNWPAPCPRLPVSRAAFYTWFYSNTQSPLLKIGFSDAQQSVLEKIETRVMH